MIIRSECPRTGCIIHIPHIVTHMHVSRCPLRYRHGVYCMLIGCSNVPHIVADCRNSRNRRRRDDTVRTPRATRVHSRDVSHRIPFAHVSLLARAATTHDARRTRRTRATNRRSRQSVFGVIFNFALVLRPGSARASDRTGVKP